jgi:hypothetical protein
MKLGGNSNNFPTFALRGNTGSLFVKAKVDSGGRANWLRNRSYGSGWANSMGSLPFCIRNLQTSSRPASGDKIVVSVNPGCIINSEYDDITFAGTISGSGHYWGMNWPLSETNEFWANTLGGYDLVIQFCFLGGSVTISSGAFSDTNYCLYLAPYGTSYSSSYVHHALPLTDTRFGTLSNSNRTWTPIPNQYIDASNYDAGIVSTFRFPKSEAKRVYRAPDAGTISLTTGAIIGLGSTSSLGTVTYSDLRIGIHTLLVS